MRFLLLLLDPRIGVGPRWGSDLKALGDSSDLHKLAFEGVVVKLMGLFVANEEAGPCCKRDEDDEDRGNGSDDDEDDEKGSNACPDRSFLLGR
jgi:hypothetical protein